jgi:hypothetical protein
MVLPSACGLTRLSGHGRAADHQGRLENFLQSKDFISGVEGSVSDCAIFLQQLQADLPV